MKEGTIYRKDTGAIEMTVVAPDEYGVFLQVKDANLQGVILGKQIKGADYYIVDGKETPRPEMPVSHTGEVYLSINEVIRVDGLQVGSRLLYPGGQTIVDDGYFEWSSVAPGSFNFMIEKFPFKEVRINAIVG